MVLYDRYASTYDQLWATFTRTSHAHVLAALDLAPVTTLLDIGAGTGELLLRLSAALPNTARLAGIEPSAGMLAVARRKLDTRPNVSLIQGNADALPYATATFDAVVSANMFHYLPDPLHALAEMRRSLAPGGQLVLQDYRRPKLAPVAALVHKLDRGQIRSYRAEEIIALLRTAGFVVGHSEEFRITTFWGGWLITAIAP